MNRTPSSTRFRWIAGVALTLLIAACAQPSVGGGNASVPELLPSLQVYTEDGLVTFVLQVTNTTTDAVRLDYRDGQSYDFVVASGDREVWRWSADQMFTQALREETLPASESLRFEATWQPPAGVRGEFTATGVLTSANHRVEQSARIVLQ